MHEPRRLVELRNKLGFGVCFFESRFTITVYRRFVIGEYVQVNALMALCAFHVLNEFASYARAVAFFSLGLRPDE